MMRSQTGTYLVRPPLKYLAGLSALLCLLASTLALTGSSANASTPSTWQKSVTLNSTWNGDFGSASSDAAIDQARQANANYVTLIIPLQQDNINSTNIYRAPFTPTDAALVHAISKAHSLGMKVSFKIHLDPNDGNWRAYINPSDRDTWYQNYSNFLNYYASLAQQNGVEQMVVGAELISMAAATSNSDNTQRWRNMISQVRQRFSGKLTYSANWGGSGFTEEFTHISFWDALDYIGISAYFSLSNYDNPSVSDIMSNWDYWRTSTIQPFQQSIGKPVLFTEVGYRSVDGSASHPWDWWSGGNYNPQEQVNAIQALTQYWSNYSWFAGLQYWDWNTNPNCCGTGDTGYEVQNKPGYTAMQTGYSDGGSTPAPVSFTLAGATVSPSSAAAGSTFSLNANFKASASSSALIDMEVYDSAGNKVFQHYMDNQAFSAGQTRTFTVSWATTSSQASGGYTLSVGVFSNDWSTVYLWSSNAASFTVGQSTAPTPTATPTSIPNTPTPTATTAPKTPTPTPAQATPTPTPVQATPTPTPTPAAGQYSLEIWWPADGVTLSGVQPFKARISNLDLSQYNMYWQVDGGGLVLMSDNLTDAPHKEVAVDVSGWNWRSSGPYTVNFVAKDLNGNLLKQQSVQIYVQN
ncbi:MAG TPA: hypothetical protein VH186_29565 [Chloroflexia bacterium]|nr:hypothetical protein [Chloroflexia bacterium]